MLNLSPISRQRLESCDPRLQRLFLRVAEITEITILAGHRGALAQEKLFLEGKTKAHFGQSLHNAVPSKAVDASPYPIDWQDRERFNLFAGVVLGVAAEQGVNIRWGGDWDRDFSVNDNKFDDLVHFELWED